MQDSTASIVAAVPSPLERTVRNALQDAEYDVHLVSPAGNLVSEPSERRPDCILYTTARSRSLCDDIDALRTRNGETPIIALLDETAPPPSAVLDAGAAECVRTTREAADWTAVLRHRIDAVLRERTTAPTRAATDSGPTAPPNSVIRESVQRVHEIASTLDELSRESAICRIAIESANEIFEFDACIVAELEDGQFVPLAATATDPRPGRRRAGPSDSIAGRTYRTEEALLVEDVEEISDDTPTDVPYRSLLSVPMGDFGVFQVLSTTVGSYDETDLNLAKLLVAHVAHAITRVRYERALTRERDRFAALFQNIPDAAIKYAFEDGQPRITAVNSAFVQHFGYEPDEAVGQTTVELLVPDTERDAAAEMYATIRDGERLDREVERVTTDGPAPFLLRSVPVSTADDTSRGYIIYTDIGELIDRERQLERQNERLDTFASVVSHDLRNPLSSASGYLELAQETGNLDHLDIVREEHDRMLEMIDNLLTLAREGASIGDVEPVDLATVVDDSWETVETEAATLSIGDLPVVDGDRARIRQAFENLFRNAIMHAGADATVTVGGFENGFYVADDGPGVPDDLKDEILEMGVSTAKNDGGTGFGLAIVTEVADGHGWTVEVTDSDSGGARFEFRTTGNATSSDSTRV